MTVTATVGGKTLFLVEASQAGMFAIRGVPPDQLQPVLAIALPERAVPVCARNDRRCDDARRLPAGASRADQLRGALPAAAGAAAAGARGHQLTARIRSVKRTAAKRCPPNLRAGRRAGGAARRGSRWPPRDFKTTAEAPDRALRRAVGQGEAAVRLRPRRAARGARRRSRAGPRSATPPGHSAGSPARACPTSGCCWCASRSPTCAPIRTTRAPVVFRAEQNVLLELGESAASPGDHGHSRLGQGPPSRRPDGLRPHARRSSASDSASARHDPRRDPRRRRLGHRRRRPPRRARGREAAASRCGRAMPDRRAPSPPRAPTSATCRVSRCLPRSSSPPTCATRRAPDVLFAATPVAALPGAGARSCSRSAPARRSSGCRRDSSDGARAARQASASRTR